MWNKEMKEGLFEKHPLWKGLGIIGLGDVIFAALGFREGYELAVITFTITLIVVVVYFDNRIGKLEGRMKVVEERDGENDKIYNLGNKITGGMRMNKKGISQLVWLVIIILIIILLYFLLKNPLK